MSRLTIRDLKEFIERHELDDDTEMRISVDQAVVDVDRLGVVTAINDEPIKHELLMQTFKRP